MAIRTLGVTAGLLAAATLAARPATALSLETAEVFSTVLTAQERGWEQALIELAVSKFFEVKPETVQQTVAAAPKTETRSTYGELPASLFVGKAGGVDWSRVMRLRQQKKGWGQIAHDLGIHPGTFNKLRKQLGLGTGTPKAGKAEAGPWVIILSRYYGLDRADIEKLIARGIPLADVAFALNAAARTGKSFEEILRLQQQLGNWEKVATTLGIKGDLLATPIDPKGKWQSALAAAEADATAKPKKPGKGKGKGRKK